MLLFLLLLLLLLLSLLLLFSLLLFVDGMVWYGMVFQSDLHWNVHGLPVFDRNSYPMVTLSGATLVPIPIQTHKHYNTKSSKDSVNHHHCNEHIMLDDEERNVALDHTDNDNTSRNVNESYLQEEKDKPYLLIQQNSMGDVYTQRIRLNGMSSSSSSNGGESVRPYLTIQRR